MDNQNSAVLPELRPDGLVRDGKSRGEFARRSVSTRATFVPAVEIAEETKCWRTILNLM